MLSCTKGLSLQRRLERANPKGKRSMKDKVKREKPRIDGQDKCRIKTKGESASGHR